MVDSPRKEKQKPFLQTRIYIFSTIKAHIIYNSFTLTWKLSIKTDYIFSSHDGYKISLRQKEQSSPTSPKLLPDVVKKHDSQHRMKICFQNKGRTLLPEKEHRTGTLIPNIEGILFLDVYEGTLLPDIEKTSTVKPLISRHAV